MVLEVFMRSRPRGSDMLTFFKMMFNPNLFKFTAFRNVIQFLNVVRMFSPCSLSLHILCTLHRAYLLLLICHLASGPLGEEENISTNRVSVCVGS